MELRAGVMAYLLVIMAILLLRGCVEKNPGPQSKKNFKKAISHEKSKVPKIVKQFEEHRRQISHDIPLQDRHKASTIEIESSMEERNQTNKKQQDEISMKSFEDSTVHVVDVVKTFENKESDAINNTVNQGAWEDTTRIRRTDQSLNMKHMEKNAAVVEESAEAALDLLETTVHVPEMVGKFERQMSCPPGSDISQISSKNAGKINVTLEGASAVSKQQIFSDIRMMNKVDDSFTSNYYSDKLLEESSNTESLNTHSATECCNSHLYISDKHLKELSYTDNVAKNIIEFSHNEDVKSIKDSNVIDEVESIKHLSVNNDDERITELSVNNNVQNINELQHSKTESKEESDIAELRYLESGSEFGFDGKEDCNLNLDSEKSNENGSEVLSIVMQRTHQQRTDQHGDGVQKQERNNKGTRKKKKKCVSEETDVCTEKQQDITKYKKIFGFIDIGGPYYEIKFAIMLYVRGICKLYGIQKFGLLTNVKGIEPFDDAIFHYYFNADDGSVRSKTCYIQLKHKMNKDNPILNLEGKNSFLHKDLQNYFKNIRQKSIFISFPSLFQSEPEDCEYILYTNGSINEKLEGKYCSCPHILSSRKPGISNTCTCTKTILSSEVRETGHGIFTFKEDSDTTDALVNSSSTPERMKEFIHAFKIFVHQASEEELDDIIQLDIKRAFNTTDREAQVIYDKLFEEMKVWWRKIDESYVITEKTTILTNILHLEYISHLMMYAKDDIMKASNIFTVDHLMKCKELIYQHSALVVSSGSVTSLSKLKLIQCLEKFYSKDYIFITLSRLLEQADKILAAWQFTDKILVIESDIGSKEEKLDLCCNLWNIFDSQENKKLIAVVQEEDVFGIYLMQKFNKNIIKYIDEFAFKDLHEHCQQQVLNKLINFQGHSVCINGIIPINENMTHFLNAEVVFKVLNNENIVIGKTLEVKEKFYIPRHLSCQTQIIPDILELAKHSAKFSFSGVTRENLQLLLSQPCEKICEFKKFENYSIAEKCDYRYFILNNDTASKDFQELCRQFSDDFHWFEVHEGTLLWKKSYHGKKEKHLKEEKKGFMKLLHEYLTNHHDSYNETKITASIIPIVAEPGMGKSALLRHMAVMLKSNSPTTWVIYMNLSDHTRYLSETKPISFLEFFNVVESESRQIEQLEIQLFAEAFNYSGNIVIMLDGFDEVYSMYKNEISDLLYSIKTSKVRQLWVASRQIMKNQLEEVLCSLSYTLIPLNEEEQTNLLLESLKNFGVTEEESNNIIFKALHLTKNYLSNENKFMGNPQHIEILAQLLHRGYIELQQDINVINLYTKFIKLKYDIYNNEKAKMDHSKPAVAHVLDAALRSFTDSHEKLALSAILTTDDANTLLITEDIVNTVFKHVEMAGIVTEVKAGKPQFINENLALYFAAQWFSNNYNEQRDFLKRNFFQNNYHDLRQIFDLILANKLKCHLDIINKRRIQDQSLSEALIPDAGERLPLHLAASYNNIDVTEKLLISGNKKKQLASIDEVLKWTPIQYAKEAKSIDVLDRLVKVGGKLKDIDNEKNSEFLVDSIKGNCIKLTLHVMAQTKEDFCDDCGNTPLHLAVWYCELPMVKEMLKVYSKGSSGIWSFTTKIPIILNNHNKDRNTPLHLATIRGKIDIINHLIKKGSKPELTNQHGNSILHLAVWTGNADIVKKLARNKNIINICNSEGNTPLHLGVTLRNSEIVQELVNNGASMSTQNNDGHTPLHLSIVADTTDVMNILLEAGCEVNETNINNDSCLHLAAELGHFETVRELVEKGANKEFQNCTENIPLHLAASQGNLEVVKFLVETGSDIKSRNQRGNTPLQEAVQQNKIEVATYLYNIAPNKILLHEAVSNGKVKMVAFLVEAGVDINFVNANGDTPLHVAVKRNRDDIAKYLIKKDANVAIRDICGNPPLHSAVYHGDINMIKCILINDSNINLINDNAETPLHIAVHLNRIEIVECLINKGADVSMQNSKGNPPLHEAVLNDHIKMISCLIQNGAKQNLCNKAGITPLHMAVQDGRNDAAMCLLKNGADPQIPNSNGNPPLHEALCSENLKLAESLVLSGININSVNDAGNTPLHLLAAMGGDGETEIVKSLVENGANCNITNNGGNIPLISAVTRGNKAFINFFVDQGTDLNQGYPDDFTPLHAAVYSGDLDITKHLIEELHANVDVCDNKNNTPIHVAVAHKNIKIVQYLVENGANTNICNSKGHSPLLLAHHKGFEKIENYLKRMDNKI